MKPFPAIAASLLASLAITAGAVTFDVTNTASGTSGGACFDRDVGIDDAKQVTGVLYHEVTHVWQWNGRGAANGGSIEGIADFVRLRARYAPAHWVKPGQGDRWVQGYDVTARFLDYCDALHTGFVAELNVKMKDGYSDDFFDQILGKNVQQLWQDYKAKYGGSSFTYF